MSFNARVSFPADSESSPGVAGAFLETQALTEAIATATQPLVEPSEIMAATARLLAEHLRVNRCAYAEVEDERCFVITGDYSRGVGSIVGRWDVAAFGPACVRCMLSGEAYVVDDVEKQAEVGTEHLLAYRAAAIRAVICVPLHKNGRFTAAMAVHQDHARHWKIDEIDLVSSVVARCWEALERSRVARALGESEARYRIMVEASPESVGVLALDGEILQMNAAGLRMLDATEERQIFGRSMFDFIVPEDHEAFRAFSERVRGGNSGTLHYGIVSLTGARRSMETTAVPLPSSGRTFSQLAVTRDVTARVSAERALAESRARLDYAVRLSGIGFWYCDLPFDELIWDAQVKTHFFLPLEARVTLETFYERIHSDDRAATQQAIAESIANHRPYDVVYRTVDPQSGAIKWIRAIGGTTYRSDGAPQRFDGVTVDVSAQKLDQERLAQVLEREREQARLLGKVAAAGLTIHRASSLDAVLSIVAEEAQRLTGADRAVTSLTKDSAAPAGLAEQVEPFGKALSVQLTGRDGRTLGFVGLTGKEQGVFTGVDRDILLQLAQIASVAVENASLYDQLREQDRLKDHFLATLAHELRNPLAPIRTGLQVLSMTTDPVQLHRTREVMERQLGHMVRLVDDLLDVSRITLEKLQLKREPVDFSAVIRTAIETTRPSIEAARHVFEVRLPSEPMPLDVDPTRLSQVFANLLNNAAKFTPRGGRIQLAAELDADSLVVRVADSGVGIPRDMLAKVFEMFTQIPNSLEGSQAGLGIGLTLARRLVEMHGGSIRAESDGATGSTFIVRLKLAAGTRDRRQNSGISQRPAAPDKLRVLVVDDNVDGAEMLAMFLKLGGHLIRLAHTGREALALVDEFHPHVVFLDIGLPDISGYDVARDLRTRPLTRQPTLIAVTGWGAEEDRRRAQVAGFDEHFVKPVDTSRVARVLEQVAERAGLEPPTA